MIPHQPHLVLASASPRRQELMKLLQIDFEVIASQAVEESQSNESPTRLVKRLAKTKAKIVQNERQNAWVVGADTIVVCNSEILGKPRSMTEAAAMLTKLSGQSHEGLTGICIQYLQHCDLTYVSTTVSFSTLTKKEIEDYLITGESSDKAGAYGIQGYGSRFITGIKGCYFNVMGLPVSHLYKRLKSTGFLTNY